MKLSKDFLGWNQFRHEFAAGFGSGFAQNVLEKTIRPGLPASQAQSVLTSLSGGNYANITVNRNAIELAKAYKNSPNLRRAVNLISYCLASTPWVLQRRKSRSSKQSKTISFNVRTAICQSHRQKMMHHDEASYEYVYDHPFLDFLSTGSPALPGMTGLKASFAYRELKGEYFWLLTRAKNSLLPIGWTLLPTHWVEEIPSTRNNFKFKVKLNNTINWFEPKDIFWSRDPDLEDPYGRGAGTGETLGDELDTDESAAMIMRQTLTNKGFMDMLIAVSNANDATIREIDARYNKEHRGPLSTGKALVFDADRIDVKPITHPLSELRLLELRSFEKNMITSVYGIPAELLGEVENRTRATILGAERTFSKFTLLPRLEAQRLDLQTQLLPLWDPKGEYLLEFVAPMPEDEERQLEIMKEQPQAFTYNEWRETAGFAAKEWGDTRSVPFSSIEVDASANEIKRDGGTGGADDGADDEEESVHAPTTPEKINVEIPE